MQVKLQATRATLAVAPKEARQMIELIAKSPCEVIDHVKLAKEALAEGRAYYRAQKGNDVIVEFEIVD